MLSKNIAIDLGTSSIKVYIQGKGVVLSQGNALCLDSKTKEIVAVGSCVCAMKEKTPSSLEVVFPIKSGAIACFSAMLQILSMIIEKLLKNYILKPNLIVTCPSSATSLEKKAIVEACCGAGSGKVCLLCEPVAGAMGIAKNIDRPYGTMVIDIGAGTSDIAVVSMGTVCTYSAVPLAGNDFDAAICDYVKKEKGILIGSLTAEKIKKQLGIGNTNNEEVEINLWGKDALTGMPVSFSITSTQVRAALADSLEAIFAAARAVLEETPPELHEDICSEGIYLTGGSARLLGIEEYFADKFHVKVTAAKDSENSAVKGAGYALKNISSFEDNGYIYKMKEKSIG